MWELDYKESWVPKNWCFWNVVLEKILESPLDCKEIQPVRPKGNQSWIFIGKTDAKAEVPILWPPDVKSWPTGKDWRQEMGMTEDEMVGWYHWLYGHVFEQAPGVGDGQGSLVCCSPWGQTQLSNWNELNSNDNIWTPVLKYASLVNLISNSIAVKVSLCITHILVSMKLKTGLLSNWLHHVSIRDQLETYF